MAAENSKEIYYEIIQELKALNQKLESAFPKDDDGEPDYASHRLFHKKQSQDEAEYKASKAKVIRDISSWLIIGILTIIGSALVQTYIIPALNTPAVKP